MPPFQLRPLKRRVEKKKKTKAGGFELDTIIQIKCRGLYT